MYYYLVIMKKEKNMIKHFIFAGVAALMIGDARADAPTQTSGMVSCPVLQPDMFTKGAIITPTDERYINYEVSQHGYSDSLSIAVRVPESHFGYWTTYRFHGAITAEPDSVELTEISPSIAPQVYHHGHESFGDIRCDYTLTFDGIRNQDSTVEEPFTVDLSLGWKNDTDVNCSVDSGELSCTKEN